MDRIKLNIIGLSSGQSNGSYTLILGEDKGKRKLPVVIGSFEAQAIAIEIEKIVPFRPMTHDLFVAFTQTFSIQVLEVEIYDLIDGVFHAKLLCEMQGEQYEIDARTSDSIALAVRFKCPIYTFEKIMEEAGVVFDDEPFMEEEKKEAEKPVVSENDYSKMTPEELQKKLDEALGLEEYVKAAAIRDELKKRRKN